MKKIIMSLLMSLILMAGCEGKMTPRQAEALRHSMQEHQIMEQSFRNDWQDMRMNQMKYGY